MKIIESRRRRLNVKLLTIVGIVGVIGWLCVSMWHSRQVRLSAKQLLDRGMTARDAGNHRLAVAELGRYVGFAPDDTDALADYTDSLSQIGSTRELREQVFALNEAILRRRPEEMKIRETQAELALELGRIPDAASHVETIEDHQELTPELWYIRGRCYEAARETDKAIESYEKTLASESTHVSATDHLANLLATRKDDTARAEKLLTDLVEKTGSVEALLLRAKRHAENKNSDAAIVDLQKAVELDPKNSTAVSAFAAAVHRRIVVGEATEADTDRREAALSSIRAQLTRDPENSPMRLYGSRLLWLQEDDRDEAIELLREGTELEPNDEALLFSLADSLISMERPDEASPLLKRFGDNVESNQKRQLLRARLEMAKGEWENAGRRLASLATTVIRDPQMQQRVRMYQADCLRELQNDLAAASSYEKTLDEAPQSTPARIGLAESYLRNNRLVAAINEYRRLKSIPTVAAFLTDLLIEAQTTDLAKKKRWDEIGTFVSAEDGYLPNEIERAVLRADAYFAMGKTSSGWRTLVESLEANPDDKELKLAIDRATALLLGYVLKARSQSQYDPATRVGIELIVDHWSERSDSDRLANYFEQQLQRVPERDEMLDRMSLFTFMVSYLAKEMETASGQKQTGLVKYADDLSLRLVKLEGSRLGQRLQFLAMFGSSDQVISELDEQTDDAVVAKAASEVVPHLYGDDDALSKIERLLQVRLQSAANDSAIKNSLGLVYSARGEFDQAQQVWREVVARSDDELSAENLAWLLAVRKSDGAAATQVLPEHSSAEDTKACVAIASGDLESAEKTLKSLITHNTHIPHLVHLAYTVNAVGRTGEARFLLNKIDSAGVPPERLHPLDRIILERLSEAIR